MVTATVQWLGEEPADATGGLASIASTYHQQRWSAIAKTILAATVVLLTTQQMTTMLS